MLQAYRGVDFQPWLRSTVGISPAQMAGLLSFRDLLRRGVPTHVWLHSRLTRTDHCDSSASARQAIPESMQQRVSEGIDSVKRTRTAQAYQRTSLVTLGVSVGRLRPAGSTGTARFDRQRVICPQGTGDASLGTYLGCRLQSPDGIRVWRHPAAIWLWRWIQTT